MLVFTADLEKVEEVCCSGVDGDGVLIFGRNGIREICYFEVGRALYYVRRSAVHKIMEHYPDIFLDLDSTHVELSE